MLRNQNSIMLKTFIHDCELIKLPIFNNKNFQTLKILNKLTTKVYFPVSYKIFLMAPLHINISKLHIMAVKIFANN